MSLNANLSGQSPQEHVYATAAAARVKGAPVYLGMSSTGFVDVSLVDDALVHKVVVADADFASGGNGLYVAKGEVVMTVPSGNYTAGHGLKVLDGAVASTGAVFPAAGLAGDAQTAFAVIKTGGTAVTSITAVLHGEQFTATT